MAISRGSVLRKTVLATVAALLPMIALQAWHGWASYDAAQVLTVHAPLRQLAWDEPHGSAKVRWQQADWDVVLAPVSRMLARGLTREMLESGDEVTLIGYPRSDGTKEMRIERLIVGDRVVEMR